MHTLGITWHTTFPTHTGAPAGPTPQQTWLGLALNTVLKRGDELALTCEFDSTGHSTPTHFGWSTQASATHHRACLLISSTVLLALCSRLRPGAAAEGLCADPYAPPAVTWPNSCCRIPHIAAPPATPRASAPSARWPCAVGICRMRCAWCGEQSPANFAFWAQVASAPSWQPVELRCVRAGSGGRPAHHIPSAHWAEPHDHDDGDCALQHPHTHTPTRTCTRAHMHTASPPKRIYNYPAQPACSVCNWSARWASASTCAPQR